MPSIYQAALNDLRICAYAGRHCAPYRRSSIRHGVSFTTWRMRSLGTMISCMTPSELVTERLRLRRWGRADRKPFAELNADPKVMEYYPEPLGRAASDAMVDTIEACFEERGFGLWAVEVTEAGDSTSDPPFAGYVGLWPATFEAPFTPAVEVGWRLAHRYWGRGYATEAGRAVLADGFGRLELDEIVSFTAAVNARSRRAMMKLGMTSSAADDFDHPSLPEGHRLRPHVLYRLSHTRGPRFHPVTP